MSSVCDGEWMSEINMCVANNADQFLTTPRAWLMNSRPSRVNKKRGYCYDDCERKKSNPRKARTKWKGRQVDICNVQADAPVRRSLRSCDRQLFVDILRRRMVLTSTWARSNQGSGGKGDEREACSESSNRAEVCRSFGGHTISLMVPEQLFVDQICSSSFKFGHWPPFFRVIGRILLEYAAVPRVTTNQIAALRSNGHFPRFLEIRGWHTKVADFLKNPILLYKYCQSCHTDPWQLVNVIL